MLIVIRPTGAACMRSFFLVFIVDLEVGYGQIYHGYDKRRNGYCHSIHQIHVHLPHVQVADYKARIYFAVITGVVGADFSVRLHEHRAVEHWWVSAAFDIREQSSTSEGPIVITVLRRSPSVGPRLISFPPKFESTT
nr:unnamed protein product [Callosobruchus chinensis]